MRARRASPARRGFTLVEMLVVVAVLGLLLGGLLVPLATRMESARYERVAEQLEMARLALIGFAAANGNRLPCPDTGAEGRPNPTGAGACDTPEGFLPHATLGVPDLDPWGNRLRYRVEADFTSAAGLPDPLTFTTNLVVMDLPADPASGEVSEIVAAAGSIAAVVFSCGPNGVADEGNNGDDTLAAVARCGTPASPLDVTYVRNTPVGDDYDDVLVWLSTRALAARLAAAGLWP